MSTASHEAELTPQATPGPTAQHPVRYAVVGAGWISQAAVLPGVAHSGNAVVTALVTGDAAKAGALAQRYRIGHVCGYADYERLLASGDIDAIYLALPADMHRQYALPALQRGIHVLLEKPMATSEADCEAMIAAARQGHAKLMIAYRLHFEPATLAAIELVRAGGLGPCGHSRPSSASPWRRPATGRTTATGQGPWRTWDLIRSTRYATCSTRSPWKCRP